MHGQVIISSSEMYYWIADIYNAAAEVEDMGDARTSLSWGCIFQGHL